MAKAVTNKQSFWDFYNSIVIRVLALIWGIMGSTPVSLKKSNKNRKQQQREQYELQMKEALLYEDWYHAAAKLDSLEGKDAWINHPQSDHYDWQLIQTRIREIIKSRQEENNRKSMTAVLRLPQTRKIGNISDPRLYKKTRVGTKALISEYTDKVVEQLYWIGELDEHDPDMTLEEKHDYFMTLRQSYGRTALLLSGGGSLGYLHIGALKALIKARLLPRIIAGSSTGSIMASAICTKSDEERIQLMNGPWPYTRHIFKRAGEPENLLRRIGRFLHHGYFYDPAPLKELLTDSFGNMTFQEAYNKSGLTLNISITSTLLYDVPCLLNYVVSPDVVIWSAVLASCAVPLFYPSQQLYAKSKSGKLVPFTPTNDEYADGSIGCDLPWKRIGEMFSVNHFIVVQINPHVSPLLTDSTSMLQKVFEFGLGVVANELCFRIKQLEELGFTSVGSFRFENLLSQTYQSDITIVPPLEKNDVLGILTDRTPEQTARLFHDGERATWKNMPLIKTSLKIELAIDAIIYNLRYKLLGESPQLPMEVVESLDYLTPSIAPNALPFENEASQRLAPNVAYDDTVPPSPSSVPFWKGDYSQVPTFTRDRNDSIASTLSSLQTPVNLRRPSLLPHDISRRGSNISIRDISSPSAKSKRRKQVTSAQYFISPEELEWVPKRNNSTQPEPEEHQRTPLSVIVPNAFN